MNAHNLPKASVVNSPPMHPQAAVGSDAATLSRIEQRLRAGSPKSGAKHVRLTDSRMIGPNEFEELGSPFHWTTYVCVIVCTTVALIFVGQGVRWFLAGVLS